MTETHKLRVGIAGCGIGRSHAEAYLKLPDQFQLSAICDIDTAVAHATAHQLGVETVFTDFSALCQQPDLDVIDICTPSFLHYPQAMQALAASKHVICEKPVAGSPAEIDDLIVAETISGKRLMPIFQYRFGHGLQKLKFLIDQGITGQAYLATVETHWRRRADYYAIAWRGKRATALGGALVTHAIHAHDALCYILGPVKSVFARTATLVNPVDVEDCVSASLEMVDGSFATLSVTLGSSEEISRHRFCFSNLSAESNTRPYSNTSDPWVFTGDTPTITTQIETALSNFIPQPEGYIGQFARFYYALHSGNELPVTLLEARQSLSLISAMYASSNDATSQKRLSGLLQTDCIPGTQASFHP